MTARNHWSKWRRQGSCVTPVGRFMAMVVERPSGCWEWQGALNNRGYGQFGLDGKVVLAHRFAWSCAFGSIPDGALILHRCDNRKCVRATHLFSGSAADNSADMVSKGRGLRRATCGRGHPMNGDDTEGMQYECGWFTTREEAQAARDELDAEHTRRYSAALRADGDLDAGDPDQPFYEWSVEEVKSGHDVRPVDGWLDTKGFLVS